MTTTQCTGPPSGGAADLMALWARVRSGTAAARETIGRLNRARGWRKQQLFQKPDQQPRGGPCLAAFEKASYTRALSVSVTTMRRSGLCSASLRRAATSPADLRCGLRRHGWFRHAANARMEAQRRNGCVEIEEPSKGAAEKDERGKASKNSTV